MSNWYTSDWHLSHENLIKSGFRDESGVAKLDKKILDNINAKVAKTDTLYVLGDITLCNKARIENAIEFINQIECDNIYICEGNHDEARLLTQLIKHSKIKGITVFKIIKDTAFNYEFNVALCHYPLLDYHGSANPVMMLHGHSHGLLPNKIPDLFDVGVDSNNFEPVTIEELLSKYYGDHPNPFLHYIDHCKEFSKEFSQFMQKHNRP